jgi:hypothetical protein
MRGRRTMRLGLLLAAIAVGGLSAACLQPAPSGPANLSVNPSTWTINAPPAGFMPTLDVTVTNTGGHAAQFFPVSGVGVYSIPSNSCTSLGPNQSCHIHVQFCPAIAGTFNNTLTIDGQDATTGTPLHAAVTLNGTSP